MTREVSSITRTGAYEPFDLQVSRGQVAYHKVRFQFGFNPDVDDLLETVWSNGGLYSYPSAATVMTVSSASSNDTSAGTGARTIEIYGLDSDYNEISEVVSLNGQTAVNTVNSYLRINRGVVRTAGSGGVNAGALYVGTGAVTLGVPANVYLSVALGDNHTSSALWTVPAGYTAYLHELSVTVATSQNNKFCTVTLVSRPFGEVFQMRDRVVVANGPHLQEYKIPLRFEEKTDIEVRAIGSSSGADISISAGIDILYIRNGSALA